MHNAFLLKVLMKLGYTSMVKAHRRSPESLGCRLSATKGLLLVWVGHAILALTVGSIVRLTVMSGVGEHTQNSELTSGIPGAQNSCTSEETVAETVATSVGYAVR